MANQLLVKKTIADLRNLSTDEIASLQGDNPVYQGVKLLGYYLQGDLPSPVVYYISNSSLSDNGGSVISVGVIKLQTSDKVFSNPKYFGIGQSNDIEDITRFFKSFSIRYPTIAETKIELDYGTFILTESVNLPSNFQIDGNGAKIISKGTTGFKFIEKKRIDISNLVLGVENGTEQTQVIFCQNCESIILKNLEINQGITAIKLENCALSYCTNNIISDMIYWGIFFLGGKDIYITSNTCFRNGRDGIKVAGNLSSGAELTVKNLNVNNNICYENGRDGIDIAINHLDGLICQGNLCRDNYLEGLDFKILGYTGGSVKNALINNNIFLNNLNRAINLQNDLSPAVIQESSYYQCIVRDNILCGGNLDSSTRYSTTIMVGGNSKTKIKFENNLISSYEDGIRINNSNNVTLCNNEINIKNRGIHLLNSLPNGTINNNILCKNRISYTVGSGTGIDAGTGSTLTGLIDGLEIFDNKITGIGTNLRIKKNSEINLKKYVNNIIGEYSGQSSKPSLPAYISDIVLCSTPISKRTVSWICYEDTNLNEGKFLNNSIIESISSPLDSNATSTVQIVNDFNTLLSKLRLSGILH